MLAHCQTHHTYLECSQSTLYEALFSAVDARDLPGMTDVDADHLRISGLTQQELEMLAEAGKKLDKLPLYIDYTPCCTVGDIRAKVMLKSKAGECDLVVSASVVVGPPEE